MAWRLEIHHIGMTSSGDATLIVAREVGTLNPRVRSALIDGGRLGANTLVHDYITNSAGLDRLDVMVATHYDSDHFGGLRGLLGKNLETYDDTLIFDQGEPGNIPQFNKGPYDNHPNSKPTARSEEYTNYLNSIDARGRRVRITAVVDSNIEQTAMLWQPADWLVGKEILWSEALRFEKFNGVLQYDPEGTWNRNGKRIKDPAEPWNDKGEPVGLDGSLLIPTDAPTIRCIGVNRFSKNGLSEGSQLATEENQKNSKSLMFLIQFGNFKYYVGGDAEVEQEDAVMDILNPTDDLTGRVHAVKLSHHGANTSSSEQFLTRLRPKAAFISNGPQNPFNHPFQEPVDRLYNISVLNGNPNGLQNYYLTGEGDLPPERNRPANAALDPVLAEVPDFPGGAMAKVGQKHVKITVSAAQAGNPANGVGVINFTVHWTDGSKTHPAVPVPDFRDH